MTDYEMRCTLCLGDLVDGRCSRCSPDASSPSAYQATRDSATVAPGQIPSEPGQRSSLGVFTPAGSTGYFATAATYLATALSALVAGVVVIACVLGTVAAFVGTALLASTGSWMAVATSLVGLCTLGLLIMVLTGIRLLAKTRASSSALPTSRQRR